MPGGKICVSIPDYYDSSRNKAGNTLFKQSLLLRGLKIMKYIRKHNSITFINRIGIDVCINKANFIIPAETAVGNLCFCFIMIDTRHFPLPGSEMKHITQEPESTAYVNQLAAAGKKVVEDFIISFQPELDLHIPLYNRALIDIVVYQLFPVIARPLQLEAKAAVFLAEILSYEFSSFSIGSAELIILTAYA